MPKLDFVIDKYQLAYYFCLKNFTDDSVSSEWKEIQKSLIEKFDETAGFLFFQPKEIGWGLNWFGYPNTKIDRFIRDRKMAEKIFAYIFESPVFQRSFIQTVEYRRTLENEWLASGEKIMQLFSSITGLSVEKEITISVLHPSLDMGSYMGNNLIEWGTPDEYKGSQSIGLAHELLHVATDGLLASLEDQEAMWKLHELIYLSIDEELRTQFGQDISNYFEGAFVQNRHEKLIETAKELIPAWKEYLKRDSRNILEFFEEIKS
jgi:hypothetical protein